MQGCTSQRHWYAAIAVALCAVSPSFAEFGDGIRQFLRGEPQTPHPSIVQVLAPEPGALARGSGTLIHTDGQFGYVITNWHVVQTAKSDVTVIFPDGHQSLARILKTDKDWDLALLLIWRGPAPAMPLASVAPQPGEPLTIAGYGQEGKFRAANGRFTTYAAPEPDMPFEMFEVSVAARQGDSGGPIVNARGELAGVLFGAGDGRTTGTQVHRVRDFVNSAFDEIRRHQEATDVEAIAASTPPRRADASSPIANYPDNDVPRAYVPPAQESQPAQVVAQPPPQESLFERAPQQELPAFEQPPNQPPLLAKEMPEHRGWEGREPTRPQIEERFVDATPRPSFGKERMPPTVSIDGAPAGPGYPPPSIPSGGITWDQLRSFFAAVGVFAVLNTFTRVLFGRRAE